MTFDILAGATIDDHATVAANATLFACAALLEVFVEITLFWGLTALVRRFYPEEGADVAAPSSRRASVIASSFAVFSVVQALLLALCFSVAVGPCDGDPALLRLFGLLMLLCFGVDAVLLLAVGRFRGKVRDDARAADLGGELDRYLADYQDTVDMAQRSARLRHDLRNQVQVVNALAERGELQLAEQHIVACWARAGLAPLGPPPRRPRCRVVDAPGFRAAAPGSSLPAFACLPALSCAVSVASRRLRAACRAGRPRVW